ncbi:MAG: tryptophan synthase subunit alpha [Thermoproteus sp.]
MAALPRPGLGVYITANWPNRDVFARFLDAVKGIADFVEIGIPTDNPKYDGPFIRSSHRSVQVKGLDALRGLRLPENTVLMGYAEDFAGRFDEVARAAAEAGAVSVLLPDLLIDMPDMLDAYVAAMRREGLAPTFFLPGKFPYALAERLAGYGPLFIYVGLYAATGIKLPVYVERNIKLARSHIGGIYLVAGFAIDSPDKARALIEAGADGLVVGTAAMRRLAEGGVKAAVDFLSEIRKAIK